MKSETVFLDADKNHRLFLRKHFPAGETRGIVQIIHGMAEHSGRYIEFIEFLVRNGYAVYIHDQRGHGKSAGSLDEYGYLGGMFKWNTLITDAREVTKIASAENSGKRIFIIGHSMGSMVLRRYMELYSDGYQGVILSGANGLPSISELAGMKIALLQSIFLGKRHRSGLIYKLQFGGYNSKFNPKTTLFEWLSRDRERVDDYAHDNYCGGPFTASFYFDMIYNYFLFTKSSQIKKTAKDKAVLFISGEDDPVSGFSKGTKQFASIYEKNKVSEVEVKIYPGCRHELLNETNRKDIYRDIINWIDKHN